MPEGWTLNVLVLLDISAIIASGLAAFLWWQASHIRQRRISANEEFDHRDLNRLIVSFNRASIRNERGALASAIAAAIVTVDLIVSHFTSG
jgi:hypothetical protein